VRSNPLFWGKAGSGILFVANDDTALVVKRSAHVMQPNLWGIPGGAVGGTEDFHESGRGKRFKFTERMAWDSAVRETGEELGVFPGNYGIIGMTTFEEGSFVFVTFIVRVDADEKRRMTREMDLDLHEASKAEWVPLRELLDYRSNKFLNESLHFGLKFTLDMIAKGK